MFVWGGQDATQVPIFNSGGLYDPATDSWAMTSAGTNVPSARRYAHCVWTGSEVLVWGGEDASLVALNTGSRYNPVADTWAAITTASAPAGRFAAAAVWAAEASPPRMLVWGGGDRFTGSYVYPALGGAYNPANDTWSPISTTSQPTPRASHTFVWTGAKLVVWGGYSAPTAPWTYYNDGGLYDPSSGTWTGTAATSLSVRYAASGVWTGSRMIVWGGYNGSPLGDGALYDPVGNAWTAMTNTGAPTARNSHVAVWTGSRMIIWSGITTGNAVLNTGGIYDPAGNTWRTMTTTNAPAPSYGYKGHWTGLPLNEMVVWGGYGAVGGAYRVMSLFVKN
jgi:N-acetylneuraminic acid mutarotase